MRSVILIIAVLAPVRLLAALHTVSGCVKDENGAAVQGATVRIEELEGPLRLQVTADAKGCYREDDVPDGGYEVSASQNGRSTGRRQIVLDERKRHLNVDLQYQPPAQRAPDAAPPMINLKMLERGASPAGRSQLPKSSFIQSLSFTLGAVDGGGSSMCRITLAKPAPAGGLLVRLSVNPTLAQAPRVVAIAAGQTGYWFQVTTLHLRGPSDVRLWVTAADDEGAESGELIIRSNTRLTVKIVGDGGGRVVSAPGGIICGRGTCSRPFPDGATVKLSAQPQPGSAFAGWSGQCNSDGTVVVSAAMTCTATFAQEK